MATARSSPTSRAGSRHAAVPRATQCAAPDARRAMRPDVVPGLSAADRHASSRSRRTRAWTAAPGNCRDGDASLRVPVAAVHDHRPDGESIHRLGLARSSARRPGCARWMARLGADGRSGSSCSARAPTAALRDRRRGGGARLTSRVPAAWSRRCSTAARGLPAAAGIAARDPADRAVSRRRCARRFTNPAHRTAAGLASST